MRVFAVGDRVVIEWPNGIGNEPRELRGFVVAPPEVVERVYDIAERQGLREAIQQATEMGLWVTLDDGFPPRYFIYDYVAHLGPVERLAELDRE